MITDATKFQFEFNDIQIYTVFRYSSNSFKLSCQMQILGKMQLCQSGFLPLF